jgi:DNA repair protein RecN (Recombination protein N)
MLNELVVEGLGVIDRAELTLERGCCALTGETGAGKTLLVAALSLLLGARSERTMVREGAGRARIEGRFTVEASHPAAGLLRTHGIVDDAEGETIELIVTREIDAEGKAGKARINGRMVTISVLEDVGGLLGEIASQHAHRRLGTSAAARRILDAFAGEEAVALADKVAAAVRQSARARRRADDLRAGERARSRELDVLRYEAAEIEAAAPYPGEVSRLTGDARRLENAEELARGVEEARNAIHGENGAGEQIAVAAQALARLAAFDDRMAGLERRLEGVGAELSDVAEELAAGLVVPDPQELESTRERLSTLARLRRKYGDDETAVLEYLERTKERTLELESTGSDLASAEDEAGMLEKHATELASELSVFRRAAAPKLERAARKLLGELALAGARVRVALEGQPLYEGGLESVELLVAANPGETPRPVAKAASGGELSRISLALHMLTANQTAETMVFDEVDAGIGGEAAHAVGRILAGLAADSGGQVLVVTHLPQVAAHARSHFRVTKTEARGRMTVAVDPVEGEERVAELSRMLAGLPASERAREHAQELLDLAGSRVGAA